MANIEWRCRCRWLLPKNESLNDMNIFNMELFLSFISAIFSNVRPSTFVSSLKFIAFCHLKHQTEKQYLSSLSILFPIFYTQNDELLNGNLITEGEKRQRTSVREKNIKWNRIERTNDLNALFTILPFFVWNWFIALRWKWARASEWEWDREKGEHVSEMNAQFSVRCL